MPPAIEAPPLGESSTDPHSVEVKRTIPGAAKVAGAVETSNASARLSGAAQEANVAAIARKSANTFRIEVPWLIF